MPGLVAVSHPAPFASRSSQVLDDAVTDLAWSEHGTDLLAGSADGLVHGFDAAGETRIRWQAHRGGLTRLCPQPGSAGLLATAGEDGCVRLWDSRLGIERAVLAEENDWVEHLAWTPDGEVLAAAARRTISLWRGPESLGIWYDAWRQVLAMAWAPDGRRLATAANKGLYLWRLDDGLSDTTEPVQLLTFPGAPVSVAWQPHGQALATGTQDGFLQIWRPAGQDTKPRQLTMRGYPGKVGCLAWHPRMPLIATAGGRDIVLWELPEAGPGARGRPLRHHKATITALAWSGDGALLASGDRSGRLCLWNAEGEPVFNQALGDEITALRWQPGSRLLAIGDNGGGLHLIGPATGEQATVPAPAGRESSHG